MQIRYGALALAVTAALSAQAYGDSKAASPKTQTGSRPASARPHFRFPAHSHATTDSVLYDQSGAAEDGAPAQDLQSSYDGYDAEGADDFVVTDAAGWTVSAFNFQVGFFTTSGTMPPPAGATYEIGIYEDASGSPGAAACAYSGLSGSLDPTNTNLSVSLSSPCALAQGTYWVSLQAVFDFPPQAFWLNAPGSAIGNEAVWREAGAFGTTCASWTPISTCAVGSSNPNFLFQVVGSIGSTPGCNPGGICLVTTVGNEVLPDACASEDTIDATIGDQLNFCYTVTNQTGIDLDYHTLQNNVDGTILSERTISIPSGATAQYNVFETVGVSNTYTSTWTAQDVASGYSSVVESGGGNCADRVFADGFETAAPGCPGSAFVDITATGTPLGLGDDDEVTATMPFSFNFYGMTSNQICIDNNGVVLFGVAACPNLFLIANASLPVSLPAPAIMPLWDDFDSESGNVYVDTRGSAPNRQYIVEWFDRVHYDGSSNVDGATFELIFNEDGTLQFEYDDVAYTAFENVTSDPDDCGLGACATIGMQTDTTLYNQYSAFEQAVSDDTGIIWSATTPQIFTSTDSVTVNVGAPQIVVNPASLTGTGAPGANGSIPFAIENHGDRDLLWTLDEAAPANLHFPPPGTRFALPLGDPAAASIARAPIVRSAKSPHARLHVPLAGPATTFAADIYQGLLETFDVQDPSTVNVVATGIGQAFVGGAFVDGDFSKLYAIAGDFGADPGGFFTLDTATGATTLIGDATNGLAEGYSGLAYDTVGATMYAASSSCGSSSHLWTIDRATGAATPVGFISGAPCIVAIAINAEGEMYGLDLSTDALYAIDKTTGDAALIGSIGFDANFGQDMAFDLASDTLYLAGFDIGAGIDSLYTVDVQTGAANIIAPIGSVLAEVDAMGIETVGGPCASPQDLAWLSLDPSSGTTAASSSTPVVASIDGTGTVDGDILAGTVCARSNDPQHHVVEVPIEYTVAAPPPPPAPTIAKAFAPSLVAPGDIATLTITLSNGAASTSSLTSALTDTFPSGLAVAAPANASTDCGGTVTTTADSVTLDAANAAIPAAGSCTIQVDVVAGGVGTFDNVIAAGALQTSSGTNASAASATLSARIPPTLTKAFNPPAVSPGTTSALTITVMNINPGAGTLAADLVDALPAGLVVATPPNETTTCSGTVAAAAGGDSVTLASGAIVPSGGCAVTVDVVAGAAGAYPNHIPSGALQTDLGTNAAPADATLDVI
ncbi:MAG: hypothetical protein ABW186_09965 [Rhodanobacteraceae bacterium]